MKRIYLRLKRYSNNRGTAKQFGTGDVYRGTKLTGYFFICEWQWKEDSGYCTLPPFSSKQMMELTELKSCVIHVFNQKNVALTFYWNKEDQVYFCPTANVSGKNIHQLVAQFIPADVDENVN